MRKLLLLLLIPALSACVTQSKCDRKYPAQSTVTIKDSIIRTTHTEYRDTTVTVYIKGATRHDTIRITGNRTIRPSVLHTSLATSTAWVESGVLRHELVQSDTTYRISINNAVRLTWSAAEKYYNKDVVKVKQVRYIPKWVWWVLAIAVGLALWTVRKLF